MHLVEAVALQLILDILEANMDWKLLSDETQLQNLVELSHSKPQIIFKHSTRCSISSVAKSRIERYTTNTADFHCLDLISYRHLSNLIADTFNVYHESPQVLLIKNGECIFDESHNAINVQELEEMIG